MYSNKKKINSISFKEWLVGFTDGDGTFLIHINPQETKVLFTFKLGQSFYNINLLYKIKRNLGVGTINLKDRSNKAVYYIKNKEHLLNYIIPIFDEYPLLSSKRFKYLIFKEALLISMKTDKNEKEKIQLIKKIYQKKIPNNYISDVWGSLTIDSFLEGRNLTLLNSIISKSWYIGFIEAKGSFYYVKKDNNKIVHAFGINQKLDIIILYSIKAILHIPSSIKIKNNMNLIETTNSRSIEYIMSYFKYNDDTPYFLGKKSFEFKIWVRTYRKYKGNYIELEKIRNWINNLKNKNKHKFNP